MITMCRLHRRSAAVLVILFSVLGVPGAFAAGKPGGGAPIDPARTCTEWPTTKMVIALDPGHGGTDPGTGYDFDGNGTRDLLEKDVVLNIATLARDTLVGRGYTVCLTRIDDSSLGNSQRGEFANAVGAQLFVMIHLNGADNKTTNYTSTFWGKKRKDLSFAQSMLTALLPLTPDGGGDYVGQFANGALLTATMESTLTESVFLTNEAEATALRDMNSARRGEIATAIADGIHFYLNPQP